MNIEMRGQPLNGPDKADTIYIAKRALKGKTLAICTTLREANFRLEGLRYDQYPPDNAVIEQHEILDPLDQAFALTRVYIWQTCWDGLFSWQGYHPDDLL